MQSHTREASKSCVCALSEGEKMMTRAEKEREKKVKAKPALERGKSARGSEREEKIQLSLLKISTYAVRSFVCFLYAAAVG